MHKPACSVRRRARMPAASAPTWPMPNSNCARAASSPRRTAMPGTAWMPRGGSMPPTRKRRCSPRACSTRWPNSANAACATAIPAMPAWRSSARGSWMHAAAATAARSPCCAGSWMAHSRDAWTRWSRSRTAPVPKPCSPARAGWAWMRRATRPCRRGSTAWANPPPRWLAPPSNPGPTARPRSAP